MDDFTAFVVARGHALTRTAFLLTGDHGEAEDLVQGVLAKAYLRWARVRAMDSPEAYVRRVLVNQHVSHWRRRRGREVSRHEVPDVVLPDPTGSVATQDLVRAVIRRLPPRQRAAVVLRYYEDLPDADIAAVLGCSAATVRSQIHRALASIRAAGHLEDEPDQPAHLTHPTRTGGEQR